MRVAINGAGIAGPTLAWWLGQSGHDVLLIEQSPELRTGGYAIDFWGVGYDIAERMGLRASIMERGFQIREMRYVDGRGRTRGGFPLSIFQELTYGRFTEISRSDLAAIIYGALGDRLETRFGDTMTAINDEGQRVRVEFEHGAGRDVDLVIGADGLHSKVRRLVFGPEKEFEVPLGYHVAAFQLAGYKPREDLVAVTHSAPGRQVSRISLRNDMTLCLFVFRDEYLKGGEPSGNAEAKASLRQVFGDVGWETPGILSAMDGVEEIYFDRVSQIRMEHWTRGRVALVGDAAACVSLLAGEGTGLAMVEAYVLAGELRRTGGDYQVAFQRYEARLMPLLRGKQKAALRLASSFAPKTSAGIVVRNQLSRLLRVPVFAKFLLGRVLKDEIELPEYEMR